MKNLFAIPRLPLSEAFTILITLVVCLAGFTEAEIHTKYRREDSNGQEDQNFLTKESSYRKNYPYTPQISNMKGDELQQNNFAYLKSFPESPLDKLIKRHSDYFGESDESDGEKENDGYGYDDDEYYHFNNKRNDEMTENIDNKSKMDKEQLGESNQKGLYNQKSFSKNTNNNNNNNEKEIKTIEMLNFKEIHPNIGGENSQNTLQSQKPYALNEMAHKKTPSSDALGTLNIVDLKENSALDEPIKERKEESGGVLASSSADSKLADSKKVAKTTEEKDSSKIKDSKLNDDSEKKDKEASLKEGKEVVATKNLKEASKNSEEKEKSVKLSESAKLEENIKSKEGDTAKIAKDEKDLPKFSDKMTADAINSKEISQINNRASFVSSDYKDNMDTLKNPESQGDEKNSEEMNDNEKNLGLSDYQQELRENQGQYKGRGYNIRKNEGDDNFELLGGQYGIAKMAQEQAKASPYFTVPVSFEYQNDNPNEFYNKRESWKDQGALSEKISHQQQALTQEQALRIQQEPSQPQIDMPFDNQKNPFQNFPSNELENTDYRRNYLKYLKKYKSQNENAKGVNPEPPSSGSFTSAKNSFRAKSESKKRKRSKLKKRRSMLSEEKGQEKEPAESAFSSTVRRNKMADTFSNQEEKCMAPPLEAQSFSTKNTKYDTKLSDGKKYEEQSDTSRQKRKSPQKLEYEIKVINQNQHDPKEVQFSRFFPKRMKKNVKTKISSDSKYLKKYPYSQVSRDDLMRLNKKSDSENEKKYKRKAPLWKRHDQKSAIKTRAAPSGYYSNRVKFGQKTYSRNNEKTNPDSSSSTEMNRMSPPYLTQVPSAADKTSQRSWEPKQQSFKHDPMKRFDDSVLLNEGNSLFLVKKGERTAKAFEDGSNNKGSDDELDPDQLAKILSKANDYVVLKKTENNKFRKISDHEAYSSNPSEYNSLSYYSKKSSAEGQTAPDSLRNSGKQISFKNKNLKSRSSNSEKEEKKYSAYFRSSSSKSNLKKTFDKFRDLADFFKDSDQESSENQNSPQEVKEGRDIVFSEDKLPDPIVISSDGSEKNEGLKPKPLNSIYSISTNFKNIDQPDRKNDAPNTESSKNMFTSEVKADNVEFSWEPALKTAFPEAKSINSMNKNGNEIIVLDFNRNQLKTDHSFHAPQKATKGQQYGVPGVNSHESGNNPLAFLGDRKVHVILSDAVPSYQFQRSDGNKNEDKKNQASSPQTRGYSVITNDLADIPSLLKSLSERKQKNFGFIEKSTTKLNEGGTSQNKISENYNKFLKDLSKLSEINKGNFMKKNSRDLNTKRSVNEIILPSSSFSELSSYSDNSIRKLGSLLQNIITKESPMYTNYDTSNKGVCKSSEEFEKSNLYQKNGAHEADAGLKRQGQWFSSEERSEDKIENMSKEDREEMNDILQNQVMNLDKEKNYEELWEEIAEASDKVHRLRREGAENRQLKKAIEDALSFRGRHDSLKVIESPDSRVDEKGPEVNVDSNILDSKDLPFAAEEGKNEKDSESQVKNDEESEDNSEEEKSMEPEYDSQLSNFFENLNRNQINPSEGAWNRKKRKNTHRQKRFSRRDDEDKVSKTEVQNTILKNLPEDNYQSVYSPGIKRKSLSTDNEAENDDGYSDADERDKNLAEEAQGNCVKNAANECVDPMILELFGTDDLEERKSRTRRSLTSPFHSNFKREIDLDESMPNDFQNFLVTSLGRFGSQKREVIKKDEPFWEGKESSPDNYNPNAENSPGRKEGYEDSALEKREVSSRESQTGKSYKNSMFYRTEGDTNPAFASVMSTLNHASKQTRSDEKSKLKSKTSKFTDDKLPTQIRIQITNASSKEKKSSKPIMDESETTSTEMENLPKEKEFFDKNKINPLLSNNLPKLHQTPKNKLSYNDYEEGENRDLSSKQKAYRTYRRRKRKKKKYVPENPMKPVKDFIAFDQKAMESLLRRYHSNQNMISDQTTQKSPVSNHLPQVETVYNPTQGTNKAQLETTRLGKINSISNKNAETSKNSLQSNDASAFDESIIRSFLKAEKMKSDKGELKEFEDLDWKPYSGRVGLGRNSGRENQFGLVLPDSKASNANPVPFNAKSPSSRYLTPYTQSVYNQKLLQPPYGNYLYQPLSPNLLNGQSLYDAIKLKQELRNRNLLGKDPLTGKLYIKPFYSSEANLYGKADEKDKQDTQLPPYMNPADGAWNNFDFNFSKKPLISKYQLKDYYSMSPKLSTPQEARSKSSFLEGRKYKKLDFEKSLDPQHTDYLDTLENDYSDEEATKESQSSEPVLRDASKKSTMRKLHETPSYYRLYNYKNSEADDAMSEDDEEIDDDYEENADDEELDDYSLLTASKAVDPDLVKNSHGTEKLRDVFGDDDVLDQFSYLYPQIRGTNFDLTKFISSPEDKFDQGILVANVRNGIGPISESSSLLRKANENSNLYGKSLMKNLNRISNDNSWNYKEKLRDDKNLDDLHPIIRNKLQKRKFDWEGKLKRRPELPKIGSRLFYAAKTEITDDRDISPNYMTHNQQSKNCRSSRPNACQVSRENPFNAEFVSVENCFENEAGENQKEINGNLMALEKVKYLPAKNIEKKGSLTDEYSDMEDIKENLENNGETVSQDNFLDNVIGKYIMRKRVKSSTNLKKNSLKTEKHEEESGEPSKHKIKRRSTEKEMFAEKLPKILKKRLSSGHLTENNFRKFHKKNFNKKRHINNLASDSYTESYTETTDEQNFKRKGRKIEAENQKKRSAFDLFKKITNKDRDNKKAENADGRTAGFEPLLSLSEKKYDTLTKEAKDSLLTQDKKLSSDSSQTELKSPLPELKAHYPNEGQQYLKAQLNERKKEKSKETLKEYPQASAQGPWKVELNDKYDLKDVDRPVSEIKKNSKNVRITEEKPLSEGNENLKAFLVISKNVKAVKRNPEEGLFPAFGSFLREVGNSYRPNSDEGRGIYKKHVRKRSLKFSNTRMMNRAEDAPKTSDDQITKEPNSKSHVNLEEKNRALHDTKSLSEGDSNPRPPHVLQRNFKKITADELLENSWFLPKERLINRKSVFPPTSDANIIRDNRHLNEEASEYLGQQIVGAILSHVSANPKFKEIIAPGLVMRAAAIKENIDYYKKKPLQQVEFSDQFRSFLKKFLYDLEELVEKNVKKRMCSKIDRQSKIFLQSLLSVPVENLKNKKYAENVEQISSVSQTCSEAESNQDPVPPSFVGGKTANSSESQDKADKLQENAKKHLRAKQCLLLKLLNDFQNLTPAEREALSDNYRFLLEEFQRTTKQLETPKHKSHYITFSEVYEKLNLKKKTNSDSKGDGSEPAQKQKNKKGGQSSNNGSCKCLSANPFSKKKAKQKNASKVCNANNANNGNNVPSNTNMQNPNAQNNANMQNTNVQNNANMQNSNMQNANTQNNGNYGNNDNNEGDESTGSNESNQNNEGNESNQNNENNQNNQNYQNKQSNENQPPAQYPCFLPYSATAKGLKAPTQKLPVLYFTEVQNPNGENQTAAPTSSSFEKVQPVNTSSYEGDNYLYSQEYNSDSNLKGKPVEFKDVQLSVPTPQSFDLLPSQSTAPAKINPTPTDSEIVGFKGEKKNDNYNFDTYLYQPYGRPTELHKLSLGDAAGLQLSLKTRDPWVSNLDVAKTLRSVPSEVLLSTPLPPPKLKNSKEKAPLKEKVNKKKSAKLKEKLRNPRSLDEAISKNSVKVGFGAPAYGNKQIRYYQLNPAFPYSIDKKFYTPKKRPFTNVICSKWPLKDNQVCPLQYVLRKSALPHKKSTCGCSDYRISPREINSIIKIFGKKRKKCAPHFLIHHPRGFVKKHKKSRALKNRESPNLL